MNKTTYIILAVVAVLAIIASIYFYNKSKTQQVTIIQPQPTQQGQNGLFNVINGITGVLQNVDWSSIFGGNKNHNCPQDTAWDSQRQACLPTSNPNLS